MSYPSLSHVTLQDYRSPDPRGWAMSLARFGYARMRQYLKDPLHLMRSRRGDSDTALLAGDLFDLAKKDCPDIHISLDDIPDDRLLYFGWRFPVMRRKRPRKAA